MAWRTTTLASKRNCYNCHGSLSMISTRRSAKRSGRFLTTKRSKSSLKRSKHSTRDFAKSRSEEHTSELQSQSNLVCRLLLEKKKKKKKKNNILINKYTNK